MSWLRDAGFSLNTVPRTEQGDINSGALRVAILAFLEIPSSPRWLADQKLAAACIEHGAEVVREHDFGFSRWSPEATVRVSSLVGYPPEELWPTRYSKRRPRRLSSPSDKGQALSTAEAFRFAIDALPVGKDIRTRLTAKLDDHISALQALHGGRG